MVFYYDSDQTMASSLFVFSRTKTIFGMVFKQYEFWFFIGLHCGVIFALRVGRLDPEELNMFNWEAAESTTLFTTFFITFYNQHCFERYLSLYQSCMNVLEALFFFVHEMVVSMSNPKLEHHRILTMKYMLACTHVFFMGTTGSFGRTSQWKELVSRGLLTRVEATQLAMLAGGFHEGVLVLAAWSMQVIDMALHEQEAFKEDKNKILGVAYIHNRLNDHVDALLQSVHDIVDILALPIPFQYFHCMNVVLLINLTLIGFVTATFGTYMTIFPYGVSVLFFMGLREVSTNLADPFNGGDSDFPVGAFLQYSFDSCICLLEAFRHEYTEHYASRVVAKTRNFSPEQLSFLSSAVLLYQLNYDPSTSSPFSWNREFGIQKLGPQAAEKLQNSVIAQEARREFKSRRSILKRRPSLPGDPGHGMKVVIDHAGQHKSDEVEEEKNKVVKRPGVITRLKMKLDEAVFSKLRRKKKKHVHHAAKKEVGHEKSKKNAKGPVAIELDRAIQRNEIMHHELEELETTAQVMRQMIIDRGGREALRALDIKEFGHPVERQFAQAIMEAEAALQEEENASSESEHTFDPKSRRWSQDGLGILSEHHDAAASSRPSARPSSVLDSEPSGILSRASRPPPRISRADSRLSRLSTYSEAFSAPGIPYMEGFDDMQRELELVLNADQLRQNRLDRLQSYNAGIDTAVPAPAQEGPPPPPTATRATMSRISRSMSAGVRSNASLVAARRAATVRAMESTSSSSTLTRESTLFPHGKASI